MNEPEVGIPQKASETKPINTEQVQQWIENGRNESAAVMYGTSLESFKRMLREGFMMPINPAEASHGLRHAMDSGSLLYYFFPVYENLQHINPDLCGTLIDRFKEGPEAEVEPVTMERVLIEEVKKSEEFYRLDNAFNRYLVDQGILPEGETISSEVRKNFDNPNYDVDDFEESGEDDRMYVLQQALKDPKKAEILRKAKERHGVTLFFGQGVFDNSEVLDFYEDERELVVARSEALPLSAISGIVVHSQQEREELLENQ